MKKIAALILVLVMAVTALTACNSLMGGPAATEAPTQAATNAPTQMPTAEPAQEATSEPAAEATQAPTTAPAA